MRSSAFLNKPPATSSIFVVIGLTIFFAFLMVVCLSAEAVSVILPGLNPRVKKLLPACFRLPPMFSLVRNSGRLGIMSVAFFKAFLTILPPGFSLLACLRASSIPIFLALKFL